ncbi:hypothetical protein PTKIN_Ptkin02bG0195800 [Pterospermum kingtungense]
MAKTVQFFALFFIIILLANQEIPTVEAKLCSRLSKKWKGTCLNSNNCDKLCRTKEKAFHGACHWRWFEFKCFCYNKCE